MNGIKLAIEDIRHMWTSNMLRLYVLGLMIVPLIYSFIYLWAVWNPTDYLYKYPLAVVNQDKGIVQKTYTVNVGKQLVKNLVSDDKMDWHEVSLQEADRGIKDGRYFVAVIIPPDFTEQAYSASTHNPRPTSLTYRINEGNGVIAATYTRAIMSKLETRLQKELTTRYLQVIFELTLQGSEGLRKAADGAKQLAAGTDQAYEGSIALTKGLNQGKDGMDKLGEGLFKLNEGANQFENGLVKLNTLVQVMNAASEKVLENIDPRVAQLKDIGSNVGLVVNSSSAIVAQMRGSLTRISNIAESTYDLARQTKELSDTAVAPLEQILIQQDQALTDAENSLYQLGEDHPELKEDPRYMQALTYIDKSRLYRANIAQKSLSVKSSLNTLENNIENNAQEAKQNERQMEKNLDDLSRGLQALDPAKFENQLTSDAEAIRTVVSEVVKFSDAAKKLEDGSTQLVNGLNKFTAGFTELRAGTERLASGSQQLQDGLKKIDQGQHELAAKLDEAANMSKDDGKTAERIAAIADPVIMREDNIHPVPSNGTGLAPYFIAISLWVGSLLLFFVIEPHRVRSMPKTPLSYIVNKYLAMASVVLFQAVILVFVLHNGLGIPTVLPPIQLYGFVLVIGLVFSALLFSLVGLFGDNVGRYVSIVLMVLQLASCGGSYPVELMPKFFQFINPYLPMTYAVHGLRGIISIGDYVLSWPDTLILIGYGFASLAIFYIFKRRNILKEIEETGTA